MTVKNVVFCDVAPCRCCTNPRFGEKYRLHLQGRKIRERGTSVSRVVQPPAHVGSWLTDCFSLKIETIPSSETSVRTSTRRHIPEDDILHRFQQFLYSCVWICCRGNLFVSWSLPSNGSTRYNTFYWLHLMDNIIKLLIP
jgi:hypothetical protein